MSLPLFGQYLDSPSSDSPEEATDQVEADNIRVLFSVLPFILQCLLVSATVAVGLLKDRDTRDIITIFKLVVGVILCCGLYFLYDICRYTLQYDTLVQ